MLAASAEVCVRLSFAKKSLSDTEGLEQKAALIYCPKDRESHEMPIPSDLYKRITYLTGDLRSFTQLLIDTVINITSQHVWLHRQALKLISLVLLCDSNFVCIGNCFKNLFLG